MPITAVLFNTGGAPGSKLDPEMADEVRYLAPGLEPEEVGEVELAEHAVTRPKIRPGAVGTVQLAEDAVNTANIAAGAVDTAALAPEAVTADKAGQGVVTSYDVNGNPVVSRQVYLSAAEYAGLETPDPNTYYYIF